MASNTRLPEPLDCSNLACDWPIWKRTILMFLLANGKDMDPEPKKIATFLWLAGPKAAELYDDGTTNGIVGDQTGSTERQTSSGTRTLDEVLQSFENFCIPKKNPTMESFKFNNIKQKEKQSFADFETELRKQIQYCEFKCECGKSYENSMLIDQIVIGVSDKKLQLRLLDTKKETLPEIVDKCKTFEAVHKNKSLLDKTIVHQTVYSAECDMPEVRAITRRCYNCGSLFIPGHLKDCRARGISCHNCGRQGNFSKFCKQTTSKPESGFKPKNLSVKPKKLSAVNWADESE
ncbi:PREDICTED: uncharacterized protein LOC108366844 isoform X2 [Rhagoletis zephyria]|uniref:uncharacterized protein LOC108366844 isoform X2 n=1 Tax=Rhagoletis zephyria TaxID=28612 RepID=UPI0008119DC5|nr:PREDICTED: uncharacterized protein LOC108366844 isoform X2 [Rhagoletis zephyria]